MERLTQVQRRERTRAALLRAATEVFAQEGYAAATVQQIAARAQLTTGALYAHFTSKQDLFLAVFDQFALQRIDDIERATTAEGQHGSPSAGADQWMEQLDLTPWRFWLHLEFARHATSDPQLRRRFAISVAAVRDAIAQLIEQQAKNASRPLAVDPLWLATVIRALGMGLALERLIDPQAVSPQLYGEAVQLIVRGLTGDPGEDRPPTAA